MIILEMIMAITKIGTNSELEDTPQASPSPPADEPSLSPAPHPEQTSEENTPPRI
jgi:hypothetical protein